MCITQLLAFKILGDKTCHPILIMIFLFSDDNSRELGPHAQIILLGAVSFLVVEPIEALLWVLTAVLEPELDREQKGISLVHNSFQPNISKLSFRHLIK